MDFLFNEYDIRAFVYFSSRMYIILCRILLDVYIRNVHKYAIIQGSTLI